MTIEEKAKAYDEALLRADEAVQKGCLDKDMFDIIFPPEESEDERIRKRLLWFLANYTGRWDYPETRMACRAWLEKQKEQKPAWSEEDDQLIGFIFDLLNDLSWRKDWAMSKEECLERLKSLRPCPSWKPSEHQMNILKAVKEYVGRGSGYWGEGLGSLIEDLEKLM